MKSSIYIDAIDRKILELLQQNGRMKISDISRTICMSIPAVVNRIEKLEDGGVILGYQARIDASKIGMGVHGYIIAGVQHVMLSRLYAYVAQIKEIIRCETIISGGKEILMEFYFRDVDALMDFYQSDIRTYIDTMTVYLVQNRPDREKILPYAILEENNGRKTQMG